MSSAENSDRMTAGDGDARDVFDDVGERMRLITSKVDSKIYFHKDAVIEYMELKGVISDLAEEKKKVERERHGGVTLARLQVLAAAATGELGAAREDLADAREKLAQRNQQLDEKDEELATATEELAVARQQLAQRNHELDEKNEELKALRLKLEEMETRNYQAEQPDGNAADPGPSQVQTTRRQTRSMQQKKRKVSGHCASRDDDLEVLREKLIEGFMELAGPRNLGVKEIGKLNEKPFQAACAAKLPPKEAEAAASKLYSAWEKLLDDPSWKPSMIGAVGSDYQDEVIGVDDDKLQELSREWGEGPYKSVVDTLVERKEYNFDGTLAYDLWNYKEGRKATLGECIDYLLDQVKQITIIRCRKCRKSA